MLNTQSLDMLGPRRLPAPVINRKWTVFCTRFSLCTSEGLQLPWILLFITDVYYSEQLWFLLTWTGGKGGGGRWIHLAFRFLVCSAFYEAFFTFLSVLP